MTILLVVVVFVRFVLQRRVVIFDQLPNFCGWTNWFKKVIFTHERYSFMLDKIGSSERLIVLDLDHHFQIGPWIVEISDIFLHQLFYMLL